MTFDNAMIKKTKCINRRLIRQILSEYFSDLKDFEFGLIRQGWENLSYLIKIGSRKYILRIYNKLQFGAYPRNKDNLLFEIDFAEFLRENNLPIPKIFKTRVGKKLTSLNLGSVKHFVVLFEFIEGKEASVFNQAKIRNVAKMQAKMHLLTKKWQPAHARFLSGYTSHQDWLKETIKKFIAPKDPKLFSLYNDYKETLDRISQKILDQKLRKMPKLLIHADVHEGNTRFVGDELTGLFDFDDCRISIVPEDIGMFLSAILQKNGAMPGIKKKIDVYFEEYCKSNRISQEEKALSIYFAAEKRLVPKFSKLRKQILSGRVRVESFSRALEETREFLKLAKFCSAK